MLVVSLDVRFRGQIGKHLPVLGLPLLNPKPTTEVEATSILPLLEREDCTLVAWYPSPYAPRTGGAYDSHHRTAGTAGRTRPRVGGVAARGPRAAAGKAAAHRVLGLECFGLESMDCRFCKATA